MSLISFNNETNDIVSNEILFSIFNDKTEKLNNLLSKEGKLNQDFLINSHDKNFFNFLLLFFRKTEKLRDIKVILRHRNICNHLKFDEKIKNYSEKLKIILSKIFLICISNASGLCSLFGYKKENFIKKIYHLIRIYYLNNLIDNEFLVNIIRLELYRCFNDESKTKIINKNIDNISSLEKVINFLLSFTEEEISNKKINEFNNVINQTCDLIKKLFLSNYNNIFLLSNSLLFYRLIELSKISLESIHRIIPLLKTVFKFSFKIDYCFNDLSDQFLIKNGENIEKKNNNIIAKNKFLEELFGCEKMKEKNAMIKHGFVFNDNVNNGLVFYANDSFSFQIFNIQNILFL